MLSVGELLRKTREDKKISLVEVEKQIKIREKFLKAVEENRWDHFSSKVYIIGIIKNYANFLNLDSKKILAFFRRDYEKKDDVRFKRRISSNYLAPETKKIAVLSLVFIIFLFFAYFIYQLKIYFSPPKVDIILPAAMNFAKEEKIKIRGKTEKEAVVTIFGDRIYQNKEGVFEYDFPLKDGKNELIIEVIGANGRKTVIKRDYYRKG